MRQRLSLSKATSRLGERVYTNHLDALYEILNTAVSKTSPSHDVPFVSDGTKLHRQDIMIVRWLLSSAFVVLYAHGWRGCAKGFPLKLQSPHRQTKYLSLTSPDTVDNYFAWARFATDQKSLSFLSGFIGGAASRVTKEIVLHPIDTVRSVPSSVLE